MPRRLLSPEERELWRRVAQTAAPLRPELDEEPAHVLSPVRTSVAVELPGPASRTAAQNVPGGRVTMDLAPDPHAALRGAHPAMDRRRFEKLRRGRLKPEARLDLHGLTSERAHGALIEFIVSAHSAGLRLVLVITGKGRPGDADAVAPHRQGILRHSLPHWLAAPPLVGRVLQIVPAHQRHGGGGAYYVYLRRRR